MTRSSIEDKALRMVSTFERAGRPVGRVTIEGKKIELELISSTEPDEFDSIEMCHGKA